MEQNKMSVPIHNGEPQIESAASLTDIIAAILGGWKIIALVMTFVVFGALLFLLISRPIYKVDSLIQLDQATKGVSSQLAPIEAMLSGELPSDGELEIIRSRSVVGKAVDELHLDIVAYAQRVFLIGDIVMALNVGAKKPVKPFLGMNSYGWGGEEITVSYLQVPRTFLEQKLYLRALKKGRFRLFDENKRLLLQGEVGKRISNRGFSIQVDTLRARPATDFVVIRNPRYDTIANLQGKLEVEEVGNQSGVIRVGYSGNNVKVIMDVVNTIIDEYVKKNMERNSEEAKKTLTFISAYLPENLKLLEKAEMALSDFRLKQGTVEIELETKGLLERSVEIQSQIEQLNLDRQDLRQKFSAFHPSVKTLESKVYELHRLLEKEAEKIKSLPQVQRELLVLVRDVDVRTSMYSYLMEKTQELKLLEAGSMSDIRVIDRAERPFSPAFPIPSVVILAALFMGFIIGVTIVVVKISFRQGVNTAEEIEKNLNTVVYAVVPYSENQEKRNKKKNKVLLSVDEPKDVAVEGLRGFVVNLHFALPDKINQAIVVSGVSLDVGKSFVSANMAQVMSNGGKKVLLIDGDLRKGHLNELFNLEQSPGLSETLVDGAEEESAISQVSDNLFVLPSGFYPANPIDLLLLPRFASLLKKWRKVYDFIIVDTPPVLAVSDATVISDLVGTTFFVIRAGENSLDDIAAAFKRYENTGQDVKGCILNAYKPDAFGSKGYATYAYYGYE